MHELPATVMAIIIWQLGACIWVPTDFLFLLLLLLLLP
jgi:hypothetical protein